MEPPSSQIISPEGIPSAEIVGHQLTIWQSANYAPMWYDDALQETKLPGRNARRREIVFSAGFIESYFYEWVRRLVEVDIVREFFPSKGQAKYTQKLCAVLRRLEKDKYIPLNTKLDVQPLGMLMKYRSGLLHGGASSPFTARQSQKEKPVPTVKQLDDLKPGWALNICKDVVLSLHRQTGTEPPKYLLKSSD